MMLGWSSLAAVLASCWKRRTTWSSWATSGGSTLIATSRSSVKSCARKTWPIPPLPSKRSSRYLASMRRCSRSRTMSTLLVLVGPSPPDTSAPHDRQNLLLPGIGVWQRKHSTTGLVIGAFCPDGAESPPRHDQVILAGGQAEDRLNVLVRAGVGGARHHRHHRVTRVRDPQEIKIDVAWVRRGGRGRGRARLKEAAREAEAKPVDVVRIVDRESRALER